MSITELIRARRSVRSFDGRALDETTKEKVSALMQEIDMGIALCHFALTAEELGLQCEFMLDDPQLANAEGEYIASYKLI